MSPIILEELDFVLDNGKDSQIMRPRRIRGVVMESVRRGVKVVDGGVK